MTSDQVRAHGSAAADDRNAATPIDAHEAAELLQGGPHGALLVAGLSVGLLFLGWMLFYFLLFVPRGAIG